MKVIKLNHRFKRFNEGFTHAIRWDSWSYNKIGRYENFLADAYGYHQYRPTTSSWYAGFGTRSPKTGYKPYYIYVRNESMITAALLAVQFKGG
jgi:hypothetical protein